MNEQQIKLDTDREWVKAHVLNYVRYFFYYAYGGKFLLNWHHYFIADILKQIIDGNLKRVIINVAPGSSKTELVSIMFAAISFAINPKSRILQISYSDDLVQRNSRKIRDILNLDEHQQLFPVRIRHGSNSVGLWTTEQGGEFRGVSSKSAVTGFRAGSLAFTDSYAGALIIDDPLKNMDKFSKPLLRAANETVEAQINTRLAHPDVPVIMIMQRLCRGDTTDHVLNSCTGDWSVFEIPALIDDEYISRLPVKYQNKITKPIDKDRFSYWDVKEKTEELLQKEAKNNFAFCSEFQQKPILLGGNLIKSEWFNVYSELPRLRYRIITADTAQKTKEHNDYSVFIHAGISYDNKVFVIDVLRGKWESPQLKQNAITFWNKCNELDASQYGALREDWVEDKVSGTGLVQELKLSGIPIKPYPKGKDKYSEVMDILTYLENGLIHLPVDAKWLSEFINEMEEFNAEMTHAHDDQVDALVMIIKLLLATKLSLYDYY